MNGQTGWPPVKHDLPTTLDPNYCIDFADSQRNLLSPTRKVPGVRSVPGRRNLAEAA